MKTPEEILIELTKAVQEAKQTIRELHEARAAALDIDKKQRDRITNLVIQEVHDQVGELTQAARVQLHNAVSEVIDEIRSDWRQKLGLE